MKKISLVMVGLMLLLTLVGCGKKTNPNAILLFYLDINGTKLVVEESDNVEKGKNPEKVGAELLEKLQQTPKGSGLCSSIPSSVGVNHCTFTGYSLVVDFDEGYSTLLEQDKTAEILMRAAVVKTLLQIDGVNYVSFTVNSEPLLDADGELIGNMNANSFVENPEKQINSSVETNLTLYFASEDGSSLVEEDRSVFYSTSVSLEKVVVEKLIEGPQKPGEKATIPANTRLVFVYVSDGVCYVNLDDGFKNQNEEISEQVVLYSIVNSLTALDSVDKVQISINGDTSGKCRYNYDLSNMYEADSSLIQGIVPADQLESVESTEG